MRLLQVGSGLLQVFHRRIFVDCCCEAQYPPYHLTNSVKAPKQDSVY